MSNGEIVIVLFLVVFFIMTIFFFIAYGMDQQRLEKRHDKTEDELDELRKCLNDSLNDSKCRQEKIIEDIGRKENGSLTYQIREVRDKLDKINKGSY